jgi:preprotein translocase subunit SecG
MVYQVVLVIHVMIAIALIGLILIQHGKGADAGAAFGSGASATVFGSQGSASFLTRTTGILAAGFFVTSLSLAYVIRQGDTPTSVLDMAPAPVTIELPVAPLPDLSVPDLPIPPAAPMPAAVPAETAVPAGSLDVPLAE